MTKKSLNIGLLGGSFNPPHLGHLHLATFAQQTLNLDEVWLLPVPLSTLKSSSDVAPFPLRLKLCALLAADTPWLHAKNDEKTIATNETADTVAYMRQHFPQHTFTWLMGADSFATVHQWGRSANFPNHMKTAVFSRSEAENTAALASPTAQNMQQHTPESFRTAPNGWCYWKMPPHAGRASDIRHAVQSGGTSQDVPPQVWQEMQGHPFYTQP